MRRETAAAVAGLGATVILACRNLDAAEATAREIRCVGRRSSACKAGTTRAKRRQQHAGANVLVGPQLDLADPNSIRFALLRVILLHICIQSNKYCTSSEMDLGHAQTVCAGVRGEQVAAAHPRQQRRRKLCDTEKDRPGRAALDTGTGLLLIDWCLTCSPSSCEPLRLLKTREACS